MLYNKILVLYLAVICLTNVFAWGQLNLNNEKSRWAISKSSSLRVKGSTNVNNFSCDIAGYDRTDTLAFYQNKTSKEVRLSGSIHLDILSFDCHNPMMTKDLRKTLKQKEFPKLHITFLSFNKFPDLTSKQELITGRVDIELAGVRKRYEVNYKISVDAKHIIYLVGYRDVNFTDFNIIPPRKIGGMIQTKDNLSVVFNLEMKAID